VTLRKKETLYCGSSLSYGHLCTRFRRGSAEIIYFVAFLSIRKGLFDGPDDRWWRFEAERTKTLIKPSAVSRSPYVTIYATCHSRVTTSRPLFGLNHHHPSGLAGLVRRVTTCFVLHLA
jgi:hypothetical protein